MQSLRLHYLAGWTLVLATLRLMAFYVPATDKILGTNYLIFFYHFPSAINCLLFFAIAGVASLVHLLRGSPGSDRAALGAVEVGVLGCVITMVTGSIWAKAAWGKPWIWHDPRLMTVAIMFLTYAGYLSLRAVVESPIRRARFAAAFGVFAALNLPLVWYANQWFPKVSHPKPSEMVFEPSMRVTMWFGVLAFFVLYTALWRTRMRVARLRDEVALLEETFALRSI